MTSLECAKNVDLRVCVPEYTRQGYRNQVSHSPGIPEVEDRVSTCTAKHPYPLSHLTEAPGFMRKISAISDY